MDVEQAIQTLYAASRKAMLPADAHVVCQQAEQVLKGALAELRRLRTVTQTTEAQVMEASDG